MATKSKCFCGAVEVELSGEPAVQAFCHCSSCRGWLGAPIHAATLWPTPNAKVVKGADKLAMYKKTDASHRNFCTSCGSPVLVLHPSIGMTDIPAGTIAGFIAQGVDLAPLLPQHADRLGHRAEQRAMIACGGHGQRILTAPPAAS